ncbi:MAG: hypothetical protein ACSLFA_24820 [Mycobacterium sp.]
MSQVAGKYRRSGTYNRRVIDRTDSRRVRDELDAIRARFPDHA